MDATFSRQTVIDLIEQNSSGPSIRLLTDAGGTREEISRDQLLSQARAVARQMQQLGVRPGDCILSLAATRREFIAAVFGTWYAGAAIVPIAQPPQRTYVPKRAPPWHPARDPTSYVGHGEFDD